MTERLEGASLRRLPTGVPGLDDVLGGGLPELSFNLVVGGPGSGKTTLVHQIMFANATPERPGLYFTILGEPPLKMLRYQQLYSFFDSAKVNATIRFVSLSDTVLRQGLAAVLDSIVQQVETASPGIVIVDSFRSVMRTVDGKGGADLEMQDFVQRLALHLTAWEATTFLIGEFTAPEAQDHPVYTISDSLLALSQRAERNSIVRKLQVVKLRGQCDLPGLHTFRITADGVRVFPRLPKPEEDQPNERSASLPSTQRGQRLSTGVAGVDEMLHGGIPKGYSVLIAGPSGSGKSVLTAEFIAEGIRRGERGVIAIFEKRPAGYLQTSLRGRELDQMIQDGRLAVVYLRPLDLSVDETLYELRAVIRRTGATRVVIDSLSGFEMAVSPGFREDFRESLYRLVGVLTGLGVTVMMTLEIEDSYGELRLGPRENAFLADVIILQRYVEIEGCLKRLMTVVKIRGSEHSKDLRLYEVTADGLVVDAIIPAYHGLLTGNPARKSGEAPEVGRASRSRRSGRKS